MTPSVREVLQGCAITFAAPPPADAGPEFGASRRGIATMLIMLAAEEAEREAGAAIVENAAIRALFDRAGAYDAALAGRLKAAAAAKDESLTIPALEAANADLRRLLIELHSRIEEAGDVALDAEILALYVAMAHGRRLSLPRGGA